MRSFLGLSMCLALTLWVGGGCESDDPEQDAMVWPDTRRPDTGTSCVIGTPQNCRACGDVCGGGVSGTTKAVCLGQQGCDIECLGAFYDVNKQADDGCEAQDDLPLHADEQQAKDLGAAKDCDDAVTTSGVLPSDDRSHDTQPSSRPNGVADWFKLKISDGACFMDGKVSVSLASLAPDATYQVSAYYRCPDSTEALETQVVSGAGGGELFLEPDIDCPGISDDGTLFVGITKKSGSHSIGQYNISIEP